MKVVNVSNGDYKVIVRDGGNIWLDVGDQSYNGQVIITGNLWVQGNTTTVSSEELTVKDNIIYINVNGGSSTGIPSGPPLNAQAGIEIDRGGSGDYANVRLIFDEAFDHIDATGAEKPGVFSFRRNNGVPGSLVGIQTCSISTEGQNLYLIESTGTGVVKEGPDADAYARNALDYTNYDLDPPTGPLTITDPKALPNVQALADYVDATLSFFDDYSISEDDTAVECIDKDAANYYRTLLDPSYSLPLTSKIAFRVDGSERGTFTVGGLTVDNINIFNDTVNNETNNLILTASTTDIVQINAVLQLDDQGLTPAAVAGSTKIYTVDSDTTPAPGKTGIYFTNQGNSDELVSKNRALLFSILF